MRSLALALSTFLVMLVTPAISSAQVSVSVTIGPPPLPEYEQPPMPAEGYIWTPGYWAYGDDGYYWVPGTWVLVPEPGLLWTPGYWAYADDGNYVWHEGYWAPEVGYYGGINYGYGYGGTGYEGGYWNNGALYYNRSVNNVSNVHVTNVYNKTVVVNNTTVNNVSYNGGPNGTTARATQAQVAAERERHVAPTAAQTQHVQAARNDRAQLASANNGKPAVVATPKPGEFSGRDVVTASRAAPYHQESKGEVAQPAKPGANPAAQPNQPAKPEAKPAPQPAKPETKPAPEPPKPEAKPAPQPKPESKPAPPPKPENKPAPPPKQPEKKKPAPDQKPDKPDKPPR